MKRSEAGSGGKRGHSNMSHYNTTNIVKLDANRIRRTNDIVCSVEELNHWVDAQNAEAERNALIAAGRCICGDVMRPGGYDPECPIDGEVPQARIHISSDGVAWRHFVSDAEMGDEALPYYDVYPVDPELLAEYYAASKAFRDVEARLLAATGHKF